VVLNHVTGAGSTTGAGGTDPVAWNDKWTNFRYVSFATPAAGETEQDYLSRAGRFSKNW
jgi:alpha-amylase